MGSRTYTLITSDLSGEEGAETYSFSWDGVPYQIDLTEVEGKDFAEVMGPYLAAARRESGVPNNPSRRTRTRSQHTDGYDVADVRAWAASNGYSIASRGRVPTDIIEAYLQAH